MCVLQIDTNPTVPWQYFFANRIVSLTSQTTATIFFFSGRSRNQRCCRCRCVVCRRREERDGRHASLARQLTWSLPYRGSIFLCLDFFCTFTSNDSDLFSFSSLSHHRSLRLAPYSSLGPFPARSKRNRARPTRGPVERRFFDRI